VPENVELVRRYFDAASRGDFASAMAAYAPEVVLVVPENVVAAKSGTIAGRDAVGEWFADWFRSFARGYRFEIETTREAGERVVLSAHHRGAGRASGVPMDWSIAYVFTIQGARIARLELYEGLDAALEAAGLAE
jgi:ketosteroid isomerase-like protein